MFWLNLSQVFQRQITSNLHDSKIQMQLVYCIIRIIGWKFTTISEDLSLVTLSDLPRLLWQKCFQYDIAEGMIQSTCIWASCE